MPNLAVLTLWMGIPGALESFATTLYLWSMLFVGHGADSRENENLAATILGVFFLGLAMKWIPGIVIAGVAMTIFLAVILMQRALARIWCRQQAAEIDQ